MSKGLASSVISIGIGIGPLIFDQIQSFYINPKNYSPDKAFSTDFPNEK